MNCCHASLCASCLALALASPARADAPVMGDWSGVAAVWMTALAIDKVVPEYTLSLRPDSHPSGLTWNVPLECHLGITQAITPSIAWYPGEGSVFVRGTYQVPIGLGDSGELKPAIVPGAGAFTSTLGSGPRGELRLWFGLYGDEGFDVRRIVGAFVGGAWERNMHLKQTWWELSVGFDMPIPIDYLVSGEEWSE